jgi:hypothetical protein
LAWALQCVGQAIEVAEEEPLYIGVDVARYGEDASIIMPRKGLQILPWEEFRGMNTISLAGFAQKNYLELEASGLAIDEIGVGAGVVDWLQKKGLPGLFGVNVSEASSDVSRYHRLRDELWVNVREKCMKGVYSFPDVKRPGEMLSMAHELCNELSLPTYDFNADGGYVVESKKKMKMRGVASPNIADALCLTEYFHNIAYRIWTKKPQKPKIKEWKYSSQHGRPRQSWMTV